MNEEKKTYAEWKESYEGPLKKITRRQYLKYKEIEEERQMHVVRAIITGSI